jgi:hypothetical protein
MSLGDRAKRSAQRARAGRPSGLAGFAYRALSRGAVPRGPSTPVRREAAHVWDERSHDGHDDAHLADLRAELSRELDRLAHPPEGS